MSRSLDGSHRRASTCTATIVAHGTASRPGGSNSSHSWSSRSACHSVSPIHTSPKRRLRSSRTWSTRTAIVSTGARGASNNCRCSRRPVTAGRATPPWRARRHPTRPGEPRFPARPSGHAARPHQTPVGVRLAVLAYRRMPEIHAPSFVRISVKNRKQVGWHYTRLSRRRSAIPRTSPLSTPPKNRPQPRTAEVGLASRSAWRQLGSRAARGPDSSNHLARMRWAASTAFSLVPDWPILLTGDAFRLS